MQVCQSVAIALPEHEKQNLNCAGSAVQYCRPQRLPASGASAYFTQKGGGRGLRPSWPPGRQIGLLMSLSVFLFVCNTMNTTFLVKDKIFHEDKLCDDEYVKNPMFS